MDSFLGRMRPGSNPPYVPFRRSIQRGLRILRNQAGSSRGGSSHSAMAEGSQPHVGRARVHVGSTRRDGCRAGFRVCHLPRTFCLGWAPALG